MARGIKHLSNAQRALVDELHQLHLARVNAAAGFRRELEIAMEERLRSLDIQKSIKMNEALRAGVPKSVISETVSQKNWYALSALFNLAADLLPVVPEREPIFVTRISLKTKPINSVGPGDRQKPLWGTYIVRDFEYEGRTWALELKGGFHLDGTASFPSEVIGEQDEVDEFLSILEVSGGKIYDRNLQAYLTNLTAEYKGQD